MTIVNSLFAFDTHQLMGKNSIRLSFSGKFNSELISMLLLMARNNIREKSAMKRTYSIMAECLENLKKHSFTDDDKEFPATFIFAEDDFSYYLATGNRVNKETENQLQKRLVKLNALDKVGLLNCYNKLITNNNNNNNNKLSGLGIGMIDMAIKSEHPFYFAFNKIDSEFSFFTLKMQINY